MRSLIIIMAYTSILLFLYSNLASAQDEDSSNNENKSENTVSGEAPDSIRTDDYNTDRMRQLSVTKGSQPELSITGRDSDTGLYSTYGLQNDSSRLSLGYHVSSNPRKLSNVAGFDFSYAHKLSGRKWIEGFIQTSKMKFESISEFNEYVSVNTKDLDSTYETVFSFGAGISYQTNYIQDFLGYDRLFETMAAYAAYTHISESLLNQNFLGPGVRADYGIHYRYSKYTHFGIKFSYNIFSVTRSPEFVDEPSARRHLSVSWLALAADIGIYF